MSLHLGCTEPQIASSDVKFELIRHSDGRDLNLSKLVIEKRATEQPASPKPKKLIMITAALQVLQEHKLPMTYQGPGQEFALHEDGAGQV